MDTRLRVALTLLAAAAALLSLCFATAAASHSLSVLRTWQPLEGTLRGLASPDHIEVEIGRDPDTRRVTAAADHMIGLQFLQQATVYADPVNPGRFRLGGFLQFWLWPATLTLLALIGALAAFVARSAGSRTAADTGPAPRRWSFSPPPATPAGDTVIVVRRPASEAWMPLAFSALGLVTFAIGVLVPQMSRFERLQPLLLGLAFLTGTVLLSLHNHTLRIAATDRGLHAASALGWKFVPWEEVKGVEDRQAYPVVRRPTIGDPLAFPGRATRSIVFANARGRPLLRMSTRMQPPSDVRRLFELCHARTGLSVTSRRIDVPDL
jgi:hypothetical protein